MILCAKVTASAMIAFRAGDGLVLSIWQSFRAARIEAIIPSTRFRPSSIRASILLYLPILYLRFLFVYEIWNVQALLNNISILFKYFLTLISICPKLLEQSGYYV